MKRILLLLMLVTSMAYGQVNNTTATNFTNSLEASRIFNLPVLVATPPVGIKPGGLSYNTVFQKIAAWNGTAWVYLLSEINADASYIKNNMTNIPEAKRISLSDSIKTTGTITASGFIRSPKSVFGNTKAVLVNANTYVANTFLNNSSGFPNIGSLFVNGFKTAIPSTYISSGVYSQVIIDSTNTQNWPVSPFSHPSVRAFDGLVKSFPGSTGNIPKGSVFYATAAGSGIVGSGRSGPLYDEFNIFDITYDHTFNGNYWSGMRMTDVDGGILGNTFLYMVNGDSQHLPSGNYGIYEDLSYNNYFGTGNTLIGSKIDNGAKLQVTGKATVSSAPTNPTDVVRLQDLPIVTTPTLDQVLTAGNTSGNYIELHDNSVTDITTNYNPQGFNLFDIDNTGANTLTYTAEINRTGLTVGGGVQNSNGGIKVFPDNTGKVDILIGRGMDTDGVFQGLSLTKDFKAKWLDGIGHDGISYAEDVSLKNTSNPRWITDKAYVDSKLSGTGTVTSFSKTDGFGIISSVTNPTTTPNHNISVDTAVIRTTSNSVSLAQLQNKFNSDAILNNTTIIPEAKRIYTLDSINTVSTLKGGSLNIVTPITFSAYPGNPYSARDFYAFKTSKTRTVGGRLGIFNTQYDPTGVIQGVERERWFFGTGGLMVFLPGKTTGDSHSGGILIGDRQLTSKSLFGFYTDSNNGYIAYSRDTASYNFTPTFTKNILSYDSLGNVRQLLSGGSFSTAGIDKYDTDLSATYTDRTKPDVGYVNTNYIKNQTATPQSASFNISGSAQSLNVISGGIASSSGNTYGSFTVGSFNGTNAVPMQMVRNQVDAIPLLILNQANASATGDIFRANFNNVNKFKVDYRGVIGVNNTLLTSLQSFRTNASGTASEAFTAQSLITLTTTGAGAATFNQSTGALNIPTNSGGGTGTVTSVATTSNNGISGTVTNSTTTPSIALTADTSILRTTANSLTLSQLQTKLNGYESISNKQNSLATDATNLKYPTVNAVNTGLANYLTLGTPQTVTGRKTFNAEIIGNSDLTLPGASILANGDINTVGAVDASGGGHFNSIVTCPAIPTNGIDLTNKTYVDGRISTSLTAYELIANKQNSLATDVTNTKYPTVTAVNSALANYVTTNSSQTGIGGTKEWTGIHRFLNPILVGVTTGFNVTYSGTGTVVTTNGGTTSFSQAIPLKSGTYALVEDLPQYISVPSGTTSVSLNGNSTYGFHATTLTTATLPVTNPAEGTLITLIGIGAGQFRISQNASQYIVSGNATTTVGTAGYIQTTTNNTTITIRYLDTNRWQVTSSNSAPTIN